MIVYNLPVHLAFVLLFNSTSVSCSSGILSKKWIFHYLNYLLDFYLLAIVWWVFKRKSSKQKQKFSIFLTQTQRNHLFISYTLHVSITEDDGMYTVQYFSSFGCGLSLFQALSFFLIAVFSYCSIMR